MEPKKWFMVVKGPRGALFMWVKDLAILCVIVGKINNMLLCVKQIIMLICAYVLY